MDPQSPQPAATTSSARTAEPKQPRRGSLQRGETLSGFLFVSPMLIGVFVLVLLPIIATMALSFADWNFIQGWDGIKWVGFENFRNLLDDPMFLRSVRNNLIFLLAVPVYMLISMVLAVLIDRYVYLKGYFKVAYFMPYVSNIVAVAVVWMVLFQPSYGPVNEVLRTFGFSNPPKWLADPDYALVSIMLITVWISIGFNMIIYIAGLQSIPRDLYEAADIDGANAWTKFTRVTFPMLSPTSFFLLVTGIISTFKVFDIIAVTTLGGPFGSTSLMVWYLYDQAFNNLKIGYASSVAAVLFLFVMLITAGQWAAQKKWVNY
ncbi:sugar ABC transporter permease [Cohnella lubricantis]|uniref:Sugar ABC transporter permease n=1 Tax=Cohnella lubricantis TaxID=2163172 RepID=A0A841TCL2_9BACL|nr:sugar ABC transporter permease [Cohnella lubricantis]MBB6679044.1 sugar ABC transporter permease [Cohnella lubricantis]MBP2120249.1 multiple sugar transport system permease protein [Cohnella lubricantis]